MCGITDRQPLAKEWILSRAQFDFRLKVLEVAMELEKFALSDKYFVDRRLYPNIDFYAGIILKAIGFPVSMFTMLFAVARTPGWIAQWKEMIEDPSQKIGRPRQLYIGSPRRDYVAIDKRSQ